MFDVAGAKIAEQLSHMRIVQTAARLQFDDQAILHKEVGNVLAKYRAILVSNDQWLLLFYA